MNLDEDFDTDDHNDQIIKRKRNGLYIDDLKVILKCQNDIKIETS